jgi:integrase/recombinase XerD
MNAAGIADQAKGPLFRTTGKARGLTDRSTTKNDSLRIIRRRAKGADLPSSTCCHTFRATDISTFWKNGKTIENDQAIAAHESPRTTKLCDRTGDKIKLDEIERIII